MSLDSLLIRGLCVSVLLIALALTQVDPRDRLGETTSGDTTTEIVASQSLDPQGGPSRR